MSALTHMSEGMPIVPPRQSFECYIALRQCFDAQGEYLTILDENQDHDYREYVESVTLSEDSYKRAALLRAPLGKAVSAGAAILKLSGEQSLATTSEFTKKLQNLLRCDYEIAADAVRVDVDYIPPFPLEERRLISTLLRGPNGKRAVEQVRQLLLTKTDANG